MHPCSCGLEVMIQHWHAYHPKPQIILSQPISQQMHLEPVARECPKLQVTLSHAVSQQHTGREKVSQREGQQLHTCLGQAAFQARSAQPGSLPRFAREAQQVSSHGGTMGHWST